MTLRLDGMKVKLNSKIVRFRDSRPSFSICQFEILHDRELQKAGIELQAFVNMVSVEMQRYAAGGRFHSRFPDSRLIINSQGIEPDKILAEKSLKQQRHNVTCSIRW